MCYDPCAATTRSPGRTRAAGEIAFVTHQKAYGLDGHQQQAAQQVHQQERRQDWGAAPAAHGHRMHFLGAAMQWAMRKQMGCDPRS